MLHACGRGPTWAGVAEVVVVAMPAGLLVELAVDLVAVRVAGLAVGWEVAEVAVMAVAVLRVQLCRF